MTTPSTPTLDLTMTTRSKPASESQPPVTYPPGFRIITTWQPPAICSNCNNYGPQAEICSTCSDPRYYYGSEVQDTDSIILLSRLLAKAIANEPDNNFAGLYADSLIDFYVREYWDARSPFTNRY